MIWLFFLFHSVKKDFWSFGGGEMVVVFVCVLQLLKPENNGRNWLKRPIPFPHTHIHIRHNDTHNQFSKRILFTL